jgi:hypothetical protein
MGDRLDWIKEKVCKNLNVSPSSFDELLERETPTGKSFWADLNAFFETEHAHEALLIFYPEEVQDEGGEILFILLVNKQ